MIPGRFDLKVYRRDTGKWRFQLWNDNAKTLPLDLTGATVVAEIRNAAAGTTITAMPCVVTPPNVVEMSLNPASWSNMPHRAVWDLQVTALNGDVATYIAGNVVVITDVTGSAP